VTGRHDVWSNVAMDVSGLLLDMYGRIPELARHAVSGLGPEDLVRAPTPGANTIGWLVWHLTRVADGHISELIPADQLWVTTDVAGRFGLPPDPGNSGYGHSAAEVAAVRPESADALLDYVDATDARVREFLADLTPERLDTIVDRNWDPPVTMGVRLVSIADDCLQHAGQAAYARGILGL
jgi:hypothetical protein